MSLTITFTEVRHPGWAGKDYFDRTKMPRHQWLYFSALLFWSKQQQQEIETFTWSEASHSDRFLQGRVEFSFSSHVPSGVQNRYTCPCSTARSKTSHGVNGRRACLWDKVCRVVQDLVQPFFLSNCSPGWRGKLQHHWGSTSPALCLKRMVLLLILRARDQPGRTRLQRDQTVHTPGQLLPFSSNNSLK